MSTPAATCRPVTHPATRAAWDIRDPISLVRAELVGLSFYWTFLAGIAVVSWIILYVI